MEATENTEDRPPSTVQDAVGDTLVSLREARFIFFSMLLFASLAGLFSAIAFLYDDITAATWLAVAALSILAGVILHMIIGLSTWVRCYYGACGVIIFVLLILRGSVEHMSLLGALGMVPGFVVVLGWRIALSFLLVLAAFCATVFYGDFYLDPSIVFPSLIEAKFFACFCGLALFSLGYGYTQEASLAELLATNRAVNALAYKDPLTGLPNRRATMDILEKRWEEYRRTSHPFAVVLCNIDDFKAINDQYGRDFGDGVLLRLTNVLVRGSRSQDLISRWGGDEFLLLLPGQTRDTAQKVAERILRRVSEIELTMLDESVRITMSIGVAAVADALDAGDIIAIADSGLFQAKHTGKNRAVSG
jgi:diguanylate cyclase (GGDEF)-like protein